MLLPARSSARSRAARVPSSLSYLPVWPAQARSGVRRGGHRAAASACSPDWPDQPAYLAQPEVAKGQAVPVPLTPDPATEVTAQKSFRRGLVGRHFSLCRFRTVF